MNATKTNADGTPIAAPGLVPGSLPSGAGPKAIAGGSGSRIAVVGRCGGVWGVMVLEGGAGLGGMGTGVARVVSQTSGKDAGFADRAWSAVAESKAKRVLFVAPLEETTARTAGLPADAAVDGASAGLYAEAYAPAGAAGHRVGGGVLRSKGAPPMLLVTSWVSNDGTSGSAHGNAAEHAWTQWEKRAQAAKLRVRCATPAAGLAALLACGAAEQVLYADGACVVAGAMGEKGALLRQVMEDDGEGDWGQTLRDVLAGVARQAGLEDGASPNISRSGTTAATGMDMSKVERVLANVPRDGVWRAELLPVLGAAVLHALGDGHELAGLARLSRHEPVAEVPALVRVGGWAGRGKVWPWLAAAAGVLLVGGPIGLTFLRADIAKQRAAKLDAAREKTKDIELKAAVYEQLEGARWPLSKMIADISGLSPVGVSVKSLRMSVGQPLSMQGEAKDAAQVNELQLALAATQQYRNIKQNRVSRKAQGEGVEFDISAEVVNVHAPVTAKEDFAAVPLAVRLYGEGASNTTMPVGAVKRVQRGGGRASGAASGAASGTSGGSSSAGSEGTRGAEASRRPADPPANEPPPALTDEEIAKLTTGEAMRGWTTRRAYLNRNAGIDSGLKSRLEEEIRKLVEQQKKANTAAPKKEGA
jgi:Tfp pilus assembly protein PilN